MLVVAAAGVWLGLLRAEPHGVIAATIAILLAIAAGSTARFMIAWLNIRGEPVEPLAWLVLSFTAVILIPWLFYVAAFAILTCARQILVT